MASKIVVDGYNLTRSSHASKRLGSLEEEREYLISKLTRYQAIRRIPITVVFDGWQGGYPIETRDNINGIKVVYSKLGEKADEVIKRMAEKWRDSLIVITSDRGIADFVENRGAAVVSSREFEKRMETVSYPAKTGDMIFKDEDYDESMDRPITTKKKGNPKRRSKIERRKMAKLRKL
ncbi:MAG: NYN domain-containing protein [Nitrospinota bacterium]